MKLYTSLENLKFKYNLPLIPSLVRRGKGWLLDLVFPRFCLGCEKEMASKQSVLVCDACFGKIILNSGVQCHICGSRISVPEGHNKRCRKKTPLKGLFAASQYQNPILKEMIHQFKYQSVESLKKPLAKLIIAYITKELLIDKLANSVLVPIPLTLKRKINRGFNQSELLAKEIGKFLNCPVINLLKRKQFASPQVEISDWQKRKENISGAFALNAKIPMGQFGDIIKVILIDDVATSGATLEEAALILRSAGIKEIYGLVVARG
ncbi:MAG: ComF family protein [Candidatus Azambacteria bacterium]|nr:ComF family protein [Candidatus Azambacteria bacterium]